MQNQQIILIHGKNYKQMTKQPVSYTHLTLPTT